MYETLYPSLYGHPNHRVIHAGNLPRARSRSCAGAKQRRNKSDNRSTATITSRAARDDASGREAVGTLRKDKALKPGFVRLFAQMQIEGRSRFAPFGIRILP